MADGENLILVAVGPDKIGLIEKISEFVVQKGGNIEDSKMAVFAGEFALILLLSGDGRNLLEIARSYNELSAMTGLNIWVKHPSRGKSPEGSVPYQLVASCMDHPGVVYKISGILSKHGINIESMETETHEAPDSGTPIFRMEATISVPGRLNIKTLREELDQVEKEENIDLRLEQTP